MPCAVLCLVPFSHRFVHGARRAYIEAALAVVVPLVPFTALVFVPFPEGASDYRILAQNGLFILSVVLLLIVYLRNVRGSAAQKVFAFFSVACYGSVVTISGNAIIGIAFENPFSDEYLYQPTSIVVFAAVGAALFAPMTIAMRTFGQLFEKPIDADTWRQLAALPAAILAIILVASWLPGLVSGIDSSYYLALVAMSIMVVVFLAWVLRTARRVADDAQRATSLLDAHEHHRAQAGDLVRELEKARAAVAELEQAMSEQGSSPASRDDALRAGTAPIVIATSTHAVSFRPADVLYVESLNRERIIHLASGEELRVTTTLAQIYDLLPQDLFAYSHRAIIVNLDCVVEVTPTDALLRSGEKVPMSRRRMAAITEALAARAHAEG